MDWMFKSMSIHHRENKGTVKSNFVTSCLTFKGLIPIVVNSHIWSHLMTGLQYKSSRASLHVILNWIQNSHKVNSKPWIMQIYAFMFSFIPHQIEEKVPETPETPLNQVNIFWSHEGLFKPKANNVYTIGYRSLQIVISHIG